MNRLTILLLASVLLLTQVAFAWSAKEHVIITRTATRNLLASDATPPAMKAWLTAAQPQLPTVEEEREYLMVGRAAAYPRGVDGLAFWSVTPDLISDTADGKQRKVPPFDVPEGSLHFLDVEYFMPKEADRTFAADLSHRPSLADIPRDRTDPRWQKAGMLPFRIDNCFDELVASIKAARLIDKPGQFPRDQHATRWAGQLAHYAADNCMPLHATIDYQCYSRFPEFQKKPRVHFDMEFRLTDGDNEDYPALREQLWQAFSKRLSSPLPELSPDVWTTSVKISLLSYEAVPMIGDAARQAYLDADGQLKEFDANAFFGYSATVFGERRNVLEMKAVAMAEGVRWTERLWLEAWKKAQGK